MSKKIRKNNEWKLLPPGKVGRAKYFKREGFDYFYKTPCGCVYLETYAAKGSGIPLYEYCCYHKIIINNRLKNINKIIDYWVHVNGHTHDAMIPVISTEPATNEQKKMIEKYMNRD